MQNLVSKFIPLSTDRHNSDEQQKQYLVPEKDTYRTISERSTGLYRDRGSRFISSAWPVSSAEEIKAILENLRKEYHDARHHCYAWVLGHDKSAWRTNDDGEPGGTAGKPILGQINSNDLTNILIVVVRYFGGTLLGTSGLIRAYRTAAAEALANNNFVERTVNDYYRIVFPWESMNAVMKILKEEDIQQSEHAFDNECSILTGIKMSSAGRVIQRLEMIEKIRITFMERR